MKVSVLNVTFAIIFCSLLFSCIVPLPATSTFLMSMAEEQLVNDLNEQEKEITSSKKNIAVLNLDWFDYTNSYFIKYQTVRVIDVYSMQEYFVKRMGGYNHADVQTIDAKNTKIFKEIYGGSWSWNRRPVWVEIDGKFYAGSSNGMPHGFDILETGEGGHTCIHFLNSKTHGTKRVDSAHQQCVEYASTHANLLNKYLFEKNV